MILRSAGLDDLAALILLERSGFPEGEQWSEQSYRDELEADDRFTVLAHDPVDGLLGAATFRIIEDDAELYRVVVEPQQRRRGVAQALLRAGIEWAQACGGRRMLLEVRDGNVAATRLYERHRFAPIALRRDYYGPGRSALVMARDLQDEEDSSRD